MDLEAVLSDVGSVVDDHAGAANEARPGGAVDRHDTERGGHRIGLRQRHRPERYTVVRAEEHHPGDLGPPRQDPGVGAGRHRTGEGVPGMRGDHGVRRAGLPAIAAAGLRLASDGCRQLGPDDGLELVRIARVEAPGDRRGQRARAPTTSHRGLARPRRSSTGTRCEPH